jgi:hypothetical protein
MERKRSVSEEQLSRMSEEQIKKIEEAIGGKLRNLIDHACNEANKMLEIYGLQAKMQFNIDRKGN